ncbi:uncharacterized protein LOC141695840 [Apium graveolens]|uniref:uncharacterized protein LOC141695840 n=1 Tax=Apium graveolens TaxID=4045 RepID=UPI003D7AB658
MPKDLANATVNGLMETENRKWDEDILVDLFNDRDRDLIKQIPLSSQYTGKDNWYWIFDGNGDFTVRSTYRQIHGEQTREDRKFWMRLWGIKLPGKMLNFIWRACINVLPTKTALANKNVEVVKACSWCHVCNEDAVHALITCCFAREMWNLVGLQRVVPVSDRYNVLQILKDAFNSSTTEQCVQIGLMCWSLWIRRNTWIWDRKAMSTFGVNAMALNLFQDWQRAQEDGPGSKKRPQL